MRRICSIAHLKKKTIFNKLFEKTHSKKKRNKKHNYKLSSYKMDQELYDEFGNYIGPELESDEESEEEPETTEQQTEAMEDDTEEHRESSEVETKDSEEKSNAVVLHEDKKYYPSANEVYGEDVETLVEDEDTQPISEPIIAPVKVKVADFVEKKVPETTYKKEFMVGLMSHLDMVRNVSLVGHLHHGKTSLMDMLIRETHYVDWPLEKEVKYTDYRKDEQQRGLSIKSTPMSLVLQDSKPKSYLMNILDTPGHVNFSDEVSASLRLSDGAIIVVDAVEGVMVQTERVIRHALAERLPIVVIINKIDRLILELRLPPSDAYFKIKHTLEQINKVIRESPHSVNNSQRISPELGNVCFASGKMGCIFSLPSFAQIYKELFQADIDKYAFAKRLWGDVYFNSKNRRFTKDRKKVSSEAKRSFIEFVLEPIYKVFSQGIAEDPSTIAMNLAQVGIRLKKSEYHSDPQPLLKQILHQFFGPPSALVDMVVDFFPSPRDSAAGKVEHLYTGPLNSPLATAMKSCDASAPLMLYVTKLYHSPDCSSFYTLGRIFSGTVKVGDRVQVLGEGYSAENEEDITVQEVSRVAIMEARYQVEVSRAGPGNWVVLEGVDSSINKTATITHVNTSDVHIMRPLTFDTEPVVKIAVEPLNPSELPKMFEGLRKISKSYPLAVTKVEQSGEHVIMGSGEIYLDCIMHDLRKLYADIEVKVADPVVSFCETVSETSSIKCFAESANKKNKLTFISEPLEKGIAKDIESGNVKTDDGEDAVADFFMEKYHWDMLAAHSVWAFGPDAQGPNILVDDTLEEEVDKDLVHQSRTSIVQGFRWGAREGPLCEDPIRNTKFRMLDADLSSEPMYRSSGQIIPTARRVAYSAFLTAAPRLMEPVYHVQIQSPLDCVKAVYSVLERRRGHVFADSPLTGTPLYMIKAYVPVIDSFGLESDIRVHTEGQAFCTSVFDHWSIVPGNPLDRNIVLQPLEPAPHNALARDFMVKTRRRKGLSDNVSINKFFDDPMLLELAGQSDETMTM
eukprot:gb/GECH01000853.1/.p1 GENE.gb/GECH01000853.1/~~gb/GECH01000853.1/.p1  ORF type:complete len:1021 (+),score=214.98 gb/GECH01000853.1/:1-3063(+)